MGKLIDLTGQRFGFWMVIEHVGKTISGQTLWLCKCDCGTEKKITSNSLRTGNSTSCGCNHNPNLIGKKFGTLLVKRLDDCKSHGRRHWLCECNCGKSVVVSTFQLTGGYSKCNACSKPEQITNSTNNTIPGHQCILPLFSENIHAA